MTTIKQICRLLEQNTAAGRRIGDVFEDWLDICIATQRMMPAHLKALAETGRPAEDDEPTADLWAKLRSIYGTTGGYFDRFRDAYHLMLDVAPKGLDVSPEQALTSYPGNPGGGPDVVGWVYQELEQGGWNGQFFTPWSLSWAMAQVTIDDGSRMVQDRLIAAKDKAMQNPATSAWLTAVTLTGIILPEEQAQAHFISQVWPVVEPYYEPITVHDPACGSGIQLLAAARMFPAWMRTLGMVQFFGQDIDRLCVKMAELNCHLYGLRASTLVLPTMPTYEFPTSPPLSLPSGSSPDQALSPFPIRIPAPEPLPENLTQLSLF